MTRGVSGGVTRGVSRGVSRGVTRGVSRGVTQYLDYLNSRPTRQGAETRHRDRHHVDYEGELLDTEPQFGH